MYRYTGVVKIIKGWFLLEIKCSLYILEVTFRNLSQLKYYM